VLWIAFRRPSSPSRTYSEMRDAYLARLATGVTAGRFTPDARPAPSDPEAERRRIMEYHDIAVEELVTRLLAWPEQALDRRRLPHPALGPLTVREMLLFTLYHNRHHLDIVKRRLAG
jgi:hypothetical protein